MKILTAFDYKHKKLFDDCFCKTLPKNTELITKYYERDLVECDKIFGSFDTLHKFPFILDVFNRCEDNERIMYCDVDMIFFKDDIEQYIEDADMNIQWDNPQGGICLGCMFLKKNENTINMINEFLKADIEWIRKNYGISLNYFRRLADGRNFNYKQLPLEFYGGQMEQCNIHIPREKWILYHATFQKGIEGKYQKLKSLMNET